MGIDIVAFAAFLAIDLALVLYCGYCRTCDDGRRPLRPRRG
jgi:hypothetical protein